MTHMRANDWVNQVAPPRASDAEPQTPASQMTVEHLGASATEADLTEFQEWVFEFMRRTGLDEQTATDGIWNGGDYVQGAIQAGLGVGPR